VSSVKRVLLRGGGRESGKFNGRKHPFKSKRQLKSRYGALILKVRLLFYFLSFRGVSCLLFFSSKL